MCFALFVTCSLVCLTWLEVFQTVKVKLNETIQIRVTGFLSLQEMQWQSKLISPVTFGAVANAAARDGQWQVIFQLLDEMQNKQKVEARLARGEDAGKQKSKQQKSVDGSHFWCNLCHVSDSFLRAFLLSFQASQIRRMDRSLNYQHPFVPLVSLVDEDVFASTATLSWLRWNEGEELLECMFCKRSPFLEWYWKFPFMKIHQVLS